MILTARRPLDMPPLTSAVGLSAIYRAHARDVARWVAHLAGPCLDVEDLVHEVFLVVQRRLSEFRGDAAISTWLYRIAERVVRNARRRERFRRWTHRMRRAEVADALAPSSSAPGSTLERDEAMRAVYEALERLPEKYRTPLVLFEIEGMPGEQIASLLGVRTQTLWVQIHRARALFLDALKEAGVMNHVAD